MGNCLKIQLKEVVQNSTLPVFGALNINGFSNKEMHISVKPINNRTLTVINNGVSSTISALTEITIAAGTKCSINKASDIIDIRMETEDAYIYSGLVDLRLLSADGVYIAHRGKFEPSLLPQSDIFYYIFFTYCRPADVSSFKNWLKTHKFTNLYLNIFDNTTTTMREMAEFGTNQPSTVSIPNSTITGVWEDFVAKRVVLGQTDGNVRAHYFNTKITLNNTATTYTDYNVNVSWSVSGDNTLVTSGDISTTIHVNSDGSWTRIS